MSKWLKTHNGNILLNVAFIESIEVVGKNNYIAAIKSLGPHSVSYRMSADHATQEEAQDALNGFRAFFND